MVQGVVFGIAKPCGASVDKQLWNFLGVEVALHRNVLSRPQRGEHQQHFVLLHQLAGLLHRLGRVVRIVQGHEVDLATVHTARGVDLVKVSLHGFAAGAIRRCRAGVRVEVTEFDFGIACTGVVFFLGMGGKGQSTGKQHARTELEGAA